MLEDFLNRKLQKGKTITVSVGGVKAIKGEYRGIKHQTLILQTQGNNIYYLPISQVRFVKINEPNVYTYY